METADAFRTSTKSLTGSVFDQITENGRGYANNTYILPNDEAEQTRLAIFHQAFLLLLQGQLTLSRVSNNVGRILDVGTGFGDWAIAMGERYPNAQIIATDISASQPTSVPPNVVFQLDDAQQDWTYSDPFDFIHMRGLAGAFADWSSIYADAHKHLRTGGAFEIVDWGLIQLKKPSKDSHLTAYNEALKSAAAKAGLAIEHEHLQGSVLEGDGLSVFRTVVRDIPLGIWSTESQQIGLGKMALIAVLEGLEAASMRLLTRELAWKAEAVTKLCTNVKMEVTRPGTEAFVQCKFVLAKKLEYNSHEV